MTVPQPVALQSRQVTSGSARGEFSSRSVAATSFGSYSTVASIFESSRIQNCTRTERKGTGLSLGPRSRAIETRAARLRMRSTTSSCGKSLRTSRFIFQSRASDSTCTTVSSVRIRRWKASRCGRSSLTWKAARVQLSLSFSVMDRKRPNQS